MALARIQVRRDTTAGWSAANPVLAAGEPGFDTNRKVLRVGDGATAWSGLPDAVMPPETVAQVLAAAEAIDGSVSLADAQMSAVQANESSAFAIQQRATIGVLDGGGDQDDINARLASIAGTGGRLVLRGLFEIDGPVVVPYPGNIHLDTTQAVVRSVSGYTGNMLALDTAALRTVTASIAGGSLVVTAAVGSFTNDDVGRSVIIPEAGPNVINAELGTGLKKQNYTAIIQSVAGDGSSATLGYPSTNHPASQAALNKQVTIHNRVSDVTLDLGVWDRQDNAGSGTNLHSIFLRRGDRVKLRTVKYRARFQEDTLEDEKPIGGKYGVSYGDMIDFDAGELGLDFQSNSDGIHGIGPLIRPKVRNVVGYTHDDVCALGLSDYASYADIAGPIVNPYVQNIQAKAKARAVLFTANVRSDYQITGGFIGSIRGETESPLVRLTGSNDPEGDISGHMGIPSITLFDIQGTPRTVSPLLSLNGRIGRVIGTGFNLEQVSGNGGLAQLDDYTDVDELTLIGAAVSDGHSGNLIEAKVTARLRSLTLTETALIKSGTGNLFYGAGRVDRVTLRNYKQFGGRGMDIRRDNGETMVVLDNVETDVPILRPSNGSTAFTVFTSGKVLYTGTNEGLVRLAGGTPSCFVHAGEGLISASPRIVSRASAGMSIRGTGFAFRQDVAELSPEPGDHVFNTVAGDVPIGLVFYDGVDDEWKALGATGSAGGITPPSEPAAPVDGVVGSDTFTTARAELSGTEPDGEGGPWGGATNTWVVSGGRAKSLGSAPGVSPTYLECGAKGDFHAEYTWRIATSGEAASRTERYFLKMIDGNNGIRLQRTGQNGASLSVSAVVAGASRTIASFDAATIPASTPAADYPVVFDQTGVTVTATVNGVTVSGDLTSGELSALEDATRFGMGTTSPLTEIDNLVVSCDGEYVPID